MYPSAYHLILIGPKWMRTGSIAGKVKVQIGIYLRGGRRRHVTPFRNRQQIQLKLSIPQMGKTAECVAASVRCVRPAIGVREAMGDHFESLARAAGALIGVDLL